MSHTSAPTFLVWSIFCTLFTAFFLFHLWRFDRFRCLRWSGAYSGAFKRLMTYSYALTIPLLGLYAIGFTVIKYQEGEVTIEPFGTIPKPHQLWTQTHQHLIFPLQMIFSVGWSLELVTHLEELCFWLYLVNSGSVQQDWFKSPYFKTWVTGAVVAVTYMPLVTIFTRSDPLRNEAFTFLAGSLGSLSLTLWFTPILWTFPTFLDSLKREGVDSSTIVRLTKFHELNTIRVVFRFFMSVPIVILGVDGVRPHVHINTSIFWTDFLTIVAGFGCCVSSGITLVIFFPRSIEGEIAERDARKQSKQLRSLGYGTHMSDARSSAYSLPYSATQQPQQLSSATYLNPSSNGHERVASPFSQRLSYTDEKDEHPSDLPKLPAIRPNRRINDKEVEMGGVDSLTEGNLSRHNVRQSGFGSALQNFKSPIDLVYMSGSDDVDRKGNDSRLTFNRRRP